MEFAERIRRIPVYPAASGYALGGDVALLASNESPYGPLPEVVEAAARAVRGAHRYPDPGNTVLRRALSDRTGVPVERIAVGNGSCDILLAAGEALLEPGAEVVYAWPSFSVYPHLAAASGARAITVPLDERDEHDLDAEFPAVAAREMGLTAVPLLHAREIPVPGSMPRVIRVLIHAYAPEGHAAEHVYLGEARKLRLDLHGAQ